MTEAVICLVANQEQANIVVASMREAGCPSTDISILLPDCNTPHNQTTDSVVPENLSVGASTGALLGGALGWLTGVGSLVIPGLGVFITAGPIMSILGCAALGSTVGGIVGGLISLGISEQKAKQYTEKILEGNILLSVHADTADQAKKAEELLHELDVSNITRATERQESASYEARMKNKLGGSLMNWDEVKGQWKEVQGKIKANWGKLTDDDLMKIDGKRDELVGRLQKHYGQNKEEIEKHIDEFIHPL